MDLFGNPELRLETPIDSDAFFSPCRVWRYWLRRVWDWTLPILCCVGLNPSKADEKKNDPTISRLIKFAKLWGYGGIVMLNLFGFRATQPDDMWKFQRAGNDPIGADNNNIILEQTVTTNAQGIVEPRTVLCAWGKFPMALGRDLAIYKALTTRNTPNPLLCLGTSSGGYPKHPLARGKSAVSYETKPVKFVMEAAGV